MNSPDVFLHGEMNLSESILYCGSPALLPERVPLRAGPLTLLYEAGSLRRISYGPYEILNRIYVAVRDPNWETVPGVLTEIQRLVREDSFLIEFQSEHRQDDILFVWRGLLSGAGEGVITFTMEGEAHRTFRSNRIGLCVLHPMRLAGQVCWVEHTDGSCEESLFPERIAPYEPFLNFRALVYPIAPAVRAEVRLEGDVFHMEDQRNWGDATYKTYSAGLAPFPARVRRGTCVRQSVSVRLLGAPGAKPETTAAAEPHATIHLLGSTRPLPPLGLCLPARPAMLSTREARRLKSLNLAHLRADLAWRRELSIREQLQLAMDASVAVGAPLELAIYLSPAAPKELDSLCRALEDLRPRLVRWLIFQTDRLTTDQATFQLAMERLASFGVPFGAGTNAYFAQVNREHPPTEADFLVYSITPLVHALDSLTLVENTAAFAETVRSARRFWGEKPILVGPITLRKRWNPDATGPERETPPGELPSSVDPRQMSLLGAGWTVAALRALIQAGADILTWYETTGWRGVMESEAGSPLCFPSLAGGVYPLYHVFADLAEMNGGVVEECRSSHPLAVDALVLRRGTTYRTLAANLTASPQPVTFPEITGRARLRLLDATTAEFAMREAENYRAASTTQVTAGVDGLTMELPPFALARLDWS